MINYHSGDEYENYVMGGRIQLIFVADGGCLHDAWGICAAVHDAGTSSECQMWSVPASDGQRNHQSL